MIEFDQFSADDHGDHADFYDAMGEKVAHLDREAEIDGKFDQTTFENWGGGPELEEWMLAHGYQAALARAKRL